MNRDAPVHKGIAALFLSVFLLIPGTLAAGTPAASSSAEQTASLHSWIEEAMKRLSAQTYYPEAARLQRLEGVTLVRMEIDRAGQLIALAMMESSGSQLLDDAALTIVANAAPFPPPGFGLENETWCFDLPVRFRLNDPPAVEPRCPAKKTGKGAGMLDGNC